MRSDGRNTPRAIEVALLGSVAGSAALLMLWLSFWQRNLLDALAQKNQAAYYQLLWELIAFIALGSLLYFGREVIKSWVSNRYRRRKFDTLACQYLEDSAHELLKQRSPNAAPEQRLVEDIRESSTLTTSLVYGAAGSIVSAAGFTYVLWQVLPSYNIIGITLHAPMVFFALVLFGVSLNTLRWVGSSLPLIETELADTEAALRGHVASIHEHSRSIALLRGAHRELVNSSARLQAALSVGTKLAFGRARVASLGFFLGPGDVFVWVLLAPLYFSGNLTFGQVFQAAIAQAAFGNALNWFFENYQSYARLKACNRRLMDFAATLDSIRSGRVRPVIRKSGTTVRVPSISAYLPNEGGTVARPPFALSSLTVMQGEKVILQAPSGYGKSTLLAALAECWPLAEGSAELPPKTVWVPQRPYFPFGTLDNALAYPSLALPNLDEVATLLDKLQLGHLRAHGNREVSWMSTLSGGELARLSVVRALLAAPDCLILDEPTSALDDANATRCWEALASMGMLTVVAISHHVPQQCRGAYRILLLDRHSAGPARGASGVSNQPSP